VNTRMLDKNRKAEAKQNWLTHPRYLEPLVKFLGHVTLDPCPHPKSFVKPVFTIQPPQSRIFYTPNNQYDTDDYEAARTGNEKHGRCLYTRRMDGRGTYYDGTHWSWRGHVSRLNERGPGTKVFANIPYDRHTIQAWARHIAGDWSDFRRGITEREAERERTRLHRLAELQEPYRSAPLHRKRVLYRPHRQDELLLLTQASVGCVWFQDHIAPIASSILIARGRWEFVDPEKVRRDGTFAASEVAPFDSMVVYIGERTEEFADSFTHLGIVTKLQ